MSPTSCQTAPPRISRTRILADRAVYLQLRAATAAISKTDCAVAPIDQRPPEDAQRQQRDAVDRQHPAERHIGRQDQRRLVLWLIEVHDLDDAQIVVGADDREDDR